jgi:putative nucleotidyltransferase with HDIG domain
LVSPKRFWQELKATVLINDEISKRRVPATVQQGTKDCTEEDALSIKNVVYDNEFQESMEFVLSCTKNYKYLFRQIFIDFDRYEIKKNKSVNSNYDKALLEYDNRYTILSQVDLYSHTMNVVIKMLELTQELNSKTRDICILLALLHDVGKANLIRKEHKQQDDNEDKHHRISANYAKAIMQERLFAYDEEINEDLINLVYDCLYHHHDDIEEYSLFLDLLKRADFAARDSEFIEVRYTNKKLLELKARK